MKPVDQPANLTILMVVDQLPYPPRNGVTLPTFHYADGLRQSHRLTLILMEDEAHPVDRRALADNEAIFGDIAVVRLRRKPKAKRLFDEMLGLDMYNQGWELVDAPAHLTGCRADVLLAAPFSAAAKWHAAALSDDGQFACRIAAVNDCTSAEYYHRCNQDFGSIAETLKGKLDRFRSSRIARAEGRALNRFNHVLMQTPTDRNLMRSIVGDAIAERVTLVPNGVRRELFDIQPASGSSTFVFVAELSSEYASIANWLVCEVWPNVNSENIGAKLLVVGKGASAALSTAIADTPNVSHVSFVDDLRTVYAGAVAAICPVFKGYGLINKALEAMASGVPVIGGVAAFNGIEGFQAGHHGVVCRPRNTMDFASAICDLLANSERAAQLGNAGRALIENQFRWERAVETVEELCARRHRGAD